MVYCQQDQTKTELLHRAQPNHLKTQDGARQTSYLPRGVGGVRREPVALDWAVTSGLRADKVEQAIRDPSDILSEYSDFKHTYKDTGAKCLQQGIRFMPLIIEAHGGGWGAHLREVTAFLASRQKAAGDWCKETANVRMAQRISTALQRENARAVLRRICREVSSAPFEEEADLDWAYASEAVGPSGVP